MYVIIGRYSFSYEANVFYLRALEDFVSESMKKCSKEEREKMKQYEELSMHFLNLVERATWKFKKPKNALLELYEFLKEYNSVLATTYMTCILETNCFPCIIKMERYKQKIFIKQGNEWEKQYGYSWGLQYNFKKDQLEIFGKVDAIQEKNSLYINIKKLYNLNNELLEEEIQDIQKKIILYLEILEKSQSHIKNFVNQIKKKFLEI